MPKFLQSLVLYGIGRRDCCFHQFFCYLDDLFGYAPPKSADWFHCHSCDEVNWNGRGSRAGTESHEQSEVQVVNLTQCGCCHGSHAVLSFLTSEPRAILSIARLSHTTGDGYLLYGYFCSCIHLYSVVSMMRIVIYWCCMQAKVLLQQHERVLERAPS